MYNLHCLTAKDYHLREEQGWSIFLGLVRSYSIPKKNSPLSPGNNRVVAQGKEMRTTGRVSLKITRDTIDKDKQFGE